MDDFNKQMFLYLSFLLVIFYNLIHLFLNLHTLISFFFILLNFNFKFVLKFELNALKVSNNMKKKVLKIKKLRD